MATHASQGGVCAGILIELVDRGWVLLLNASLKKNLIAAKRTINIPFEGATEIALYQCHINLKLALHLNSLSRRQTVRLKQEPQCKSAQCKLI